MRYAFFVSVVWGTTFLVSKGVLVSGVSPETLTMLRFVMAYAILSVLCRLSRRHSCESCHVSLTDEVLFALIGVTGGSGYFLLEYSALQHTSAADVGLITSAVPLLTTAILAFWRHQRPTRSFVAATLLATLGVALVVTGGAKADAQSSLLGDLLAVGDLLAWTAYTILLVHLEARFPPLFVARRLFLWATVTLAPFWLLNDGIGNLCLASHAVASIAYLGAVASALCVWLWGVATERLGPQRTSLFLLLMPVVALIASALVCPDELSFWNVTGALLVITGIALSEKLFV